jgi:hypothetical protein
MPPFAAMFHKLFLTTFGEVMLPMHVSAMDLLGF